MRLLSKKFKTKREQQDELLAEFENVPWKYVADWIVSNPSPGICLHERDKPPSDFLLESLPDHMKFWALRYRRIQFGKTGSIDLDLQQKLEWKWEESQGNAELPRMILGSFVPYFAICLESETNAFGIMNLEAGFDQEIMAYSSVGHMIIWENDIDEREATVQKILLDHQSRGQEST